MTASDVTAAIERERARLLAAIDALGERGSTATVTDEGWTAKEVLAHLVHWATQVAFALGAPVTPPAYMREERARRIAAGIAEPPMPTGEESNALAVAHYRRRSLGDVRSEFELLIDAILERVRARSDDDLNATDAVPWAPGRPLWHFVGGETFLHWPLHAHAIERAAR